MQEFHDKTNLTEKNSFEQTQFIDYRTQARSYKLYPSFFRRYKIDDYEEISFFKNFGKVSQIRSYGKQSVQLRVNPSAGGLYPCEIYIQIREVKGLLSGIYHYEPLSDSICLIHEFSLDGLEPYFKKQNQQKFIFLISNAYFRSSWKYDKRAIRYILLDTGHQLASIYSALTIEGFDFSIEFDFEKKLLNEEFAFDSFEFFQVALCIENNKKSKIRKIREKLVGVCATDYRVKNSFVEEFFKLDAMAFKELEIKNFFEEIMPLQIQESIDRRRSTRVFKQESISKKEFEFITKDIFSFAFKYDLEIFFINHNIDSLKKGSFKEETFIKKGDFKELSSKLAFNQKLAGNSCFTLFFTSKKESNYTQNSIICGFLAHIISLRASSLGIGSSGIGAYFDDLCQEFFQSQNNFLYLQAVGR